MNVIFVIAAIIVIVGRHGVRSYIYNECEVHEFESFAQLENEMMHRDETTGAMVAKSAMIVGVYSRYCKFLVDSPIFRGIEKFASQSVKVVTVPVEGGFIYQMDECAEMFWYNKGGMDPRGHFSNFDYLPVRRFVGLMRDMTFNISNHFDIPVEIHTADEEAGSVSVGVLQPHTMVDVRALMGSTIMISRVSAPKPAEETVKLQNVKKTTDVMTEGVLDFFNVEDPVHHVHPNNKLQLCQAINEQDPTSASGKSLLPPTKMISVELQHAQNSTSFYDPECASLDARWKVWFTQDAYRARITQNYLQAKIVKPVTDVGFELRRMPEETYAWLHKFFYESGEGVRNTTNGVQTIAKKRGAVDEDLIPYNDRMGVLVEELSSGTCINTLDVRTEIKMLDIGEKERLVGELIHIFQEWYGAPLAATSVYGVRRYRTGAILRMHLDTINTHAVSAIINVGQQTEEDWPLVILDHTGIERTISMQPGDLLLYESAKLVHGRPSVFKGDFYDNIFMHFMPVEGWNGEYDWFNNIN